MRRLELNDKFNELAEVLLDVAGAVLPLAGCEAQPCPDRQGQLQGRAALPGHPHAQGVRPLPTTLP